MALKDLVVPALCVLGTLYCVKGCDKERRYTSYRDCPVDYATQPVEREIVQPTPVYYQETYEQPVRVIHRRVIRRTVTPNYQYYYEEY